MNLIDEIKKLKPQIITDKYSDGFQNAIKMVLNKLNQHNIITAPKQIKLSEIVSKLNDIYECEFYFNKELNSIGTGEYDKEWFMDTWTSFVHFKNNKIFKIYKSSYESLKWLYTLWIAGTEIIDDLEEEK